MYQGTYGGAAVAVKPVNEFGHGPVPWAKEGELPLAAGGTHPTGLTGPGQRAREFWWSDEVAHLREAAKRCPDHIVRLEADLPLDALPADAMKAEQDKVAAGQGGFVAGCMAGMSGQPPNKGAVVQHLFFNSAAFAHLGASKLMVLGLAERGTLAGAADDFAPAEMAKAINAEGAPAGDGHALRAAFVAEMAAQLAEAVVACHQSGFLHMDVHLQNVLVDAEYNARLTDFGCTRTIETLPAEIRAEAEQRKMAYSAEDFVRWAVWDDEALATAVRRLWDPSVKDRMFPGTMYPASQIGIVLLKFHARDAAAKAQPPHAPPAGTVLPPALQAVVAGLTDGVRAAGVADGEDVEALIDGATARWGFKAMGPPAGEAPPPPAEWAGAVDGAALEAGVAQHLGGVVDRVAAAAAALRAAAAELKQAATA